MKIKISKLKTPIKKLYIYTDALFLLNPSPNKNYFSNKCFLLLFRKNSYFQNKIKKKILYDRKIGKYVQGAVKIVLCFLFFIYLFIFS